MNPNRRERHEDVTAVCNPERKLRHSCQTAAASSNTTPVGHQPIAPPSLEAALEEVAKPVLTAEIEDAFESLADRPLSGEGPVSWICLT